MKFELDYSQANYKLSLTLERKLKKDIETENKFIESRFLKTGLQLWEFDQLDIFLIVDDKITPSKDPSDYITLTTLSRKTSTRSSYFLYSWKVKKQIEV